MLYLLSILLAVVSGHDVKASDLPFTMDFDSWHDVFGKEANFLSSSKSLEDRKAAFAHNLRVIEAHNLSGKNWKMGVNQFSDLTGDEFKQLMNKEECRESFEANQRVRDTRASVKASLLSAPLRRMEAETFDAADLGDSLDWVAKGAVTPVKNQGQCGSCWSFSVTGGAEGANFVTNGALVSLSEEQLVACDTQDSGCNGGLMDWGFEYIMKNKGITGEADFPYSSGGGSVPSCPAASKMPMRAQLDNYHDVTVGPSYFKTQLNISPLSIAIEADQSSFQSYRTGVMSDSCGTSLDHGVLAVGYGTLNGEGYWKVKNSWGSSWGMDGFILLAQGKNGNDGQCGLLMQASRPIATSQGPTPPPVPTPHPTPGPTPPPTDFWGKPVDGKCGNDQVATVNPFGLVTGDICSPKCGSDGSTWGCVAAPAGVTADPECTTVIDDEDICALRCESGGDAACGTAGMTCKDVAGIFSFCMWD